VVLHLEGMYLFSVPRDFAGVRRWRGGEACGVENATLIQGRWWTQEQIELIRQLIAAHPESEPAADLVELKRFGRAGSGARSDVSV
jgi:hypothetical protein